MILEVFMPRLERRLASIFLLFFLIAAFQSAAFAVGNDLSVSAHLERSDIHVGEPVNFEIVAQWSQDKELQVHFPSPPELSGFEIIGSASAASSSRTGENTVYKKIFTYILSPRKTGEAIIGQVTLEYKIGEQEKSLSTRQVRANIQPAPKSYAPLIKKGLLGVLALVIFVAVVRVVMASIRKRKSVAESDIPVRKTIEEIALEKIKTGEKLSDSAEYFSLISSALREYLKEKYQINITTTSSVLAALPGCGVHAEYADRVEHILVACDAVKFARHQPDKEKIHQIQDDFITLIKREGCLNE